MEITKGKFLSFLNELKKDNTMQFTNGSITNTVALRRLIKHMRQNGYKTLRQEIMITMIKKEAEEGNKFGVMYLTQFCVYWDKEFKDIFEIDMGQVDMLLRKYYNA